MLHPAPNARRVLGAGEARALAWLTLAACGAPPLFAQDLPAPAGESVEATRPISYGVEIAFGSGHADRGFLINDRPVVQPVAWMAGGGVVEFSAWSSFPLAETSDGSRPEIVELELTLGHDWGNLSLGSATRMYFYHDPTSPYSTRSIEGWLYLSYHAGPFRLFSNHSLDVMTNPGAYFGEVGIASEGHVASMVEIGGSVGTGWASATFNEVYAGVAKSALNRINAEGWLTTYVTPHLYIGSRLEFNTIIDPELRAELAQPGYTVFKLLTGGEF